MKLTIWKAVLQLVGTQTISVPAGSRFLCAREQNETACVWFRCDPQAAKVDRIILIVGTGHEAPAYHAADYLGTCSLQGGALMLHVFERRSP